MALRAVGASFWSDPLGAIQTGLLDRESSFQTQLREFERENRDYIQLATAGAACSVGTVYLGAGAAPLVCLPLKGELAQMGAAGQLVDPAGSDALAADARAWQTQQDAGGWLGLEDLTPKTDTGKAVGLGLLVLLLLAALT